MKKKIIFTIVFGFLSLLPMTAVEWQESSLSYKNVPVYRVVTAPEVYVVYYAKYGEQIGYVTIPKRWTKRTADTPAKLRIRSLPVGLQPYLTIITKDKQFYKAYLTVPNNRNSSAWEQTMRNDQFKDDGKETIELDL